MWSELLCDANTATLCGQESHYLDSVFVNSSTWYNFFIALLWIEYEASFPGGGLQLLDPSLSVISPYFYILLMILLFNIDLTGRVCLACCLAWENSSVPSGSDCHNVGHKPSVSQSTAYRNLYDFKQKHAWNKTIWYLKESQKPVTAFSSENKQFFIH